jgi:hypothetical protein
VLNTLAVPNQRKPTKVHLGGYFEASLKARLKQQAEARGVDMSVLLEEILTAAVEAYEKKILRYPIPTDEALRAAESPNSAEDIRGTIVGHVKKRYPRPGNPPKGQK